MAYFVGKKLRQNIEEKYSFFFSFCFSMEVLFGWLLSWLELLVFSLTSALVELAPEEDDRDDTAAQDHTTDEGRGVEVLAAVTLGRGRRWFCGGRSWGRVTGARRFS